MIHLHSETTYYAEGLMLPTHCAVCDSDDAEPFSYVQGHFPIAIPGFGGIHRQTHVSIPYCKYHAEAFQFRFRVLQVLQFLIIPVIFGCLFWGFALEDQNRGAKQGWNIPLTIGMFSFFILLPATLIARQFMYDAFFYVRPGCIQVKSKHPQFLDRLTTANTRTDNEAVQREETGNA
jgi:hypothetical protein